MKRSNIIYSALCLITALVLTTGNNYAQETKPADSGEKKESGNNKEKRIGTYLDKAHAKERANRLDNELRDDIYKLQVVVANFGGEKEKSTLKTIVDKHLNAKKDLFKRKYLTADQGFQDVKQDIFKLFTDLSDSYETKANDILSKCAEALVDKEIGIGSTRDAMASDTAARTSQKITSNRIKLLIAYDQLNMADKFQFQQRLSDSITHYRLAKLYGINILVDLAETEDEKNKLRSEYKADLADGENLISK
jgi:DNA primase catalytic subunit